MSDEYRPEPCPRCGKPLQNDGLLVFDVDDPFEQKGVGFREEWCPADPQICGYIRRRYENGFVGHYLRDEV